MPTQTLAQVSLAEVSVIIFEIMSILWSYIVDNYFMDKSN